MCHLQGKRSNARIAAANSRCRRSPSDSNVQRNRKCQEVKSHYATVDVEEMLVLIRPFGYWSPSACLPLWSSVEE